MNQYIKKFSQSGIRDVAEVGGKNAMLGELFTQLSPKGIRVPDGFAVTVTAFRQFMEATGLRESLHKVLVSLDSKDFTNLEEVSAKARGMVSKAPMPGDLSGAISRAYRELCVDGDKAVAVRSSATGEDWPQTHFSGLYESYPDVRGEAEVIAAVQQCFASLFTERAIRYRVNNGIAQEAVALSVGIQKMVCSDGACSGVAITLEPQTGFQNIIHISGVPGMGETGGQDIIRPDEFLVFKPTLNHGRYAIIQKKMGSRAKASVYASLPGDIPAASVATESATPEPFVLPDAEITQLAKWCLAIEAHFQQPMRIEWARDGVTNQLYVIQARLERIYLARETQSVVEYHLVKKGQVITSGEVVGNKVVVGRARIIRSPGEGGKLQAGEIVVTDTIEPGWEPVLRKAAAIVTNRGGLSCHASIVARELGMPAIVGCGNATEAIKNGEVITISCCEGRVGTIYRGEVAFKIVERDFTSLTRPELTEVMLSVDDPDKAFQYSFYPNNGVGLLPLDFIVKHSIRVHPMALAHFDTLEDEGVKAQIETLAPHCPDKKQYFVDKLVQSIATVAAAFFPKDVMVRMSDFTTTGYAALPGGRAFEPVEENPVLGFHGASRYYHELYKEAFALECAAVKRVRSDMGLYNVKVLVPLCRTIAEAQKVIEVMEENGLSRAKDASLSIYMMTETPGNVVLAEKFAKLFDGFFINPGMLTQLTLGVDKDSAVVGPLFNEKDEAAKWMIGTMIEKARAAGVPVGLCGQSADDDPAFTHFLVRKGINSITFSPDALVNGIKDIRHAEKELLVL